MDCDLLVSGYFLFLFSSCYLFLQSGTNLNVKPPSVRAQPHPLEGGGLKLAVVHPQGLQAERRTVL